MHTLRRLCMVLLAIFTTTVCPQLSASLIGDTITGCLVDISSSCPAGNVFDSSTATVNDPGIEFTTISGSAATYSADFFDDSFTLVFDRTAINGALLNQTLWEFTDLDFSTGQIANVELVAGNTFPVDSIAFGPDSISIVTGSVLVPGFTSVEAQFNIGVSIVPIPAAIWLFTSGLLGLIGVSRRKKSI